MLTSCRHTLCMTCTLLLQSNSQSAAAACPTCGVKFLPQHVKQLPPALSLSRERWRRIIEAKHRKLIVYARAKDGKRGSEELSHPGQKTQGDGVSVASPGTAVLEVADRQDCFLVEPETSSSGPGLLQGISDKAFFFSTKMRLLLALLEADVRAGRSCVVFSQWTSMLDLLEVALERADAARAHSVDALHSTPDEEDDEVVEVGIGVAGGNQETLIQSKQDGLPSVRSSSGTNAQSKLKAQTHRLYHYRRIDGTSGLEARQRIIKWFSEPGTAPKKYAADTASNRSADEVGPFMGSFGLSCFSEVKGYPSSPTEHSVHLAPPSQYRGKVPHLDPSRRNLGKILLLSLKTGNVGLNLVSATRCYLIDGWWNPQVETQAMRRIWRYGQVRLGILRTSLLMILNGSRSCNRRY